MLKLKNMNEKRFVDHDISVEDYVESLENRNTKEKTKRDVKLLGTFLRNEKNDETTEKRWKRIRIEESDSD